MGVKELRILPMERCQVIGGSIDNGWLLGLLGNFFSKLQLASDINNRYHVLCVAFVNETDNYGVHNVYFCTDLVTGARPARHEGAMMIKSVWLRGTGWENKCVFASIV